MIGFIKGYFDRRATARYEQRLSSIADFEPTMMEQSDEQLKELSISLKKRVQSEEVSLDDLLPEAFALVREVAKRTLGQRPYDVQLIAGQALHAGSIVEMGTGEGKTLAAVAPTYLNALTGKGVHVVTVNDYLARRDAVWMGQIYEALGLQVSCLVPEGAYVYDPAFTGNEEEAEELDEERDETGGFRVQQEFLRPVSRPEAYQAEITYGPNHEFGFDYLRDNLVYDPQGQSQKTHHYTIIDEADSILIDEARTPLIISSPDNQSSELYKTFSVLATQLKPEEHYDIDEEHRAVNLLPEGADAVEKALNIENLYAPEHVRLVRFLDESLKAHALFKRDKQYVVKQGEIVIVDEFTGRLMEGRRYSGGLHQAIEAKEGVQVQKESRTFAKISIQNYFRQYEKISGMTGTAETSAEEFDKVYGLPVMSVPPHRPIAREDLPDVIYKDKKSKYKAIVEAIKERNKKGQPILVGTTSIDKNEELAAYLQKAGVPFQLLNAKNNEKEGETIAQAGRPGAVTVATNLAGRGVDIILGGNPPEEGDQEKVKEAGGLHVIATERHDARRVDNQLRGRAGRQGDPGSSQFFLSLDDDLLRIFGGDRLRGLMQSMMKSLPDNQPIEMKLVSRSIAEAQSRVEGRNFDIRKSTLEYDDVLNKQRDAVYTKRQELLEADDPAKIAGEIASASKEYLRELLKPDGVVPEDEEPLKELQNIFTEAGITSDTHPWPTDPTVEDLEDLLEKRSLQAADNTQTRLRVLGILDNLWMNHLEDLEDLRDSVGLRGYAQREPIVEYRREAAEIYNRFWQNFRTWLFMNAVKLADLDESHGHIHLPNQQVLVKDNDPSYKDVGRNDPCPCGSGKKYKKCGLPKTKEHQENVSKKA